MSFSFINKIHSKYKIISDALGYITRRDLHDKLPDLAKAYDQAYEARMGTRSRRPDIKIVASDTFSFPSEKYEGGSWHIIYAYMNGKVVDIPVEQYFGKQQKLVPQSMILDCIRGNLNICYLYIHPSDANLLLNEGKSDLSENEWIVLHVMKTLKPVAREKEYYYLKYKRDDYKKQQENPNEYKDTLKDLEKKGLVKISSSGSAQLTLEGKNKALKAKNYY